MKILGRYFWVPRYLYKRYWQRRYYYESILRRRSAWTVTMEGITLQLGFISPYHHSIAEGMSGGTWEKEAVHAWAELCKEHANTGQVIYDIGGYNGIYGIIAAKIDPSAKVFIYEPDPLNARQCRENVKRNGLSDRVVVREMALSDVDGTVKFQADGSTGAAIGKGGTYEMHSERLDTQRPRPALIKIDIEGAEADMLLAAPETLKAKPRILLELHAVVPEEKRRVMWDMLKRSGYHWQQLPSEIAAAEEPHYVLR
jgi:FkbM family methyltransferase